MKYLFLLLLPFSLQAQYENLKFEDKRIYYEKVYIMDSISASKIESLLAGFLPTVNGFADFTKTPDIITGKLDKIYIDYKKYGGKWGNTLLHLNHPFTGSVSAYWKDGRYRILVTNMFFMTDGFGKVTLEEVATNLKGDQLRTSKPIVNGLQYVEKYLSDLFIMKKVADW